VSLHEEKKELLAQIKSMREWVVEVEHIFDGSWASQAEEITNVEVARRFDAYLERLSCFLEAPERTEDETLRLGHLFKVLTHLRPGLVQCYDIEGFPRTNNEMERTIRAIKMHYRRISGRKNWNQYLLRYGRCVASSRMVAAATQWRSLLVRSLTACGPGILATGSARNP
jgi:hypothetical protein